MAFVIACTANLIAQEDSHLKARSADDRRVVLDVIIRPGIASAEDVALIDNGTKIATKDIELLSPGHAGGSRSQVILVIDAINSSFQEVARMEETIEIFLKSKKGELTCPTSIVVLSDTAPESASRQNATNTDTKALHKRQLFAHRIPATKDANALVDALAKYKVGLHRILESQAAAGQGERVQLSLQALSFLANGESAEPGPKVVVWIGPGWPFLAKSNAQSSEQVFDSVVYISDLLRSTRMILYSVDPRGVTSQDNSAETEAFLLSSRPGSIRATGRAPDVPTELSDSYYMNFLSGVRSANESNPNDLALQVLAFQSGGLVLQHNNDLKAQIARCFSDAENVSSLAYSPARAKTANTYHAVTVKLSGRSEPLRTRTGYYLR